MEGAALPAAPKVCRRCRVEKNIDQFYDRRGNGRLVLNCLECRDRLAGARAASTAAISAMSAIGRGESAALSLPDPVHLAPRQNLTHRVLASMYHEGGRLDTDTPEMAAARGQVSAIRRQHRVQRRQGEEPSQTPTMSGLLRQQQPADAEDGPASAQQRDDAPSAVRDDEDNPQATQPQLPRAGRIPARRRPPPSSPPRSHGRQRGRPRLSRNPLMADGVCKRCHDKDDKKRQDEPFLLSAENKLDFGAVPPELPQLEPLEELCIARVHVSVNVFTVYDASLRESVLANQRQVRGQQYKYRGHVVHFLRDVGKVYSELPLLPKDLDIVILRPRGSEAVEQMDRQFRNRFRVRRAAVETWLRFLANNHLGYRNFTWNYDNLSQLPEDGDVFDQLNIHEVAESGGLPADSGPVEEPEEDREVVDEAAVPNMLIHDSELNQLQGRVKDGATEVNEQVPLESADPQAAHQLQMPSIRRTPLDEFNQKHALLSLACPTLFPRGVADFDGRFAKHHSFRFIALNTLMRQQARGHSRFYVSKNHRTPLTKEALQEALADPDTPEAQAILNRISRYASVIKGTRPFWYRRRRECESFAHCLGVPSAFITLSPADLHWQSLYRHMPEYEEWKALDEPRRMAKSRRLLRENPHIAAWHFHSRNSLCRKIVLKKKSNVADFWYRYEWQGRGSSHSHGLYWFHGSPAPDMATPEARERFARIWGYHVTAVSPQQEQGADEGNPLSVDPLETPVTWEWLNRIVNRCQRHHCSSTYCLRVTKEDAQRAREAAGEIVGEERPAPEPTCRFLFPRPVRGAAEVIEMAGKGWWSFEAERNDTHLNQYNPLLSLCWLANTDCSPCTSAEAVINHAAKYCSKSETQTSTYAQIAQSILPHISDNNPMISFVSKMMNKLIGERDYSAQEICHILLGLPLQEDSRVVQSVDCRPRERHARAIDITADGDIEESRTVYEKYLRRPDHMEDVSYFEFLQNWNFKARNPVRWAIWQAPALPRVLYYYPRYKPVRSHQQYSDFCRVKLLLSHPHRQTEDLSQVDGRQFDNHASAYRYCLEHHDHPDDHYGTVDEPDPSPDEEEFEPKGDAGDITLEDWQEVARLVPDIELPDERADLLGRRDLDVNYDWARHIGRYYHEEAKNENRRPPPLRLQIDGGGGTGKSYMVKVISSHLQAKAAFYGRPSPIVRAAPTGVASNQIGGQTLHSLLRLPVDGNYRSLSETPTTLNALQRRFRGIHYLVIDEKSMLGLKTLAWIDQRLREVFPENRDEFFGGLSVILIGDFFQLPPVLDKPLYSTRDDLKDIEMVGRNAYLSFDNFADALRIYPTKAQVVEYNHQHMLGLDSPAIQVEAKHEGVGAEKVKSSNAGNLAKRLPLCVGCRVILTRNLWADVGLVNGAQGTVYDISWKEGADVLRDPPEPLLSGEKLAVPILRVRQDFMVGANSCSRDQFPLWVSYAITVHKSQGITLDKVACDISAPEFASGLSYVAVSRVKTLGGLMFERPFDRSRIYRETPSRAMGLKLSDHATRQLQASDAVAVGL
ncbi:hypothetical protein CHGG_05501 [Chaetomium globosum CBS 148.51]|uniref:ATP-dependent DNA helicase n=1 Tax=Chaetomium globosum (strain ATCC 6205 / CBS 148.51 / DSM 1962 / NBRC 6347 / NRRL 1970) TaxID=306901 RepID=Q2H764_CHAGB|nr:uncharacterized protein CHGG_05501 [Chaetomium globosum CBS 148.51]EAQ88882.1 hypothetical protein CHGG_05501 [Chaetomium globosum CBS 148.51]